MFTYVWVCGCKNVRQRLNQHPTTFFFGDKPDI